MNYYLERELPPARYKEREIDTKPYAHTITRFNYTRKLIDQIDQNPEKHKEYINRIRAGHYGGLTWIDQQLERILAILKDKNKLDNTLIIYTSDHGTHLGDHDLIHKGTLYERSSHVPFVIWWPKTLKPGKLEGFTSHVDLFPTLVEIAGGDLPDGLEGESYYDVLTGMHDAPDTAIIEILGSTALVTKNYKYGMYRQLREDDLYDRQNDPSEFENIAGKPEEKELVKHFRDYLFRIDPTLEKGFENAPEIKLLPTVVELRQGETLSRTDCPYFGGKSFKINAVFETGYVSAGPILTHYEGQHGFSVFIDEGILKIGFRRWNDDTIINITGTGTGKNIIELTLGKDGVLRLVLNNDFIGTWQTPWPKPVQPGRKEYLTGIICAGTSGPNWVQPIGTYKIGSEFKGEIESIRIELLDAN